MVDKGKSVSYEHVSVPPSEKVRWQVSCEQRVRILREDKGYVGKTAVVVVEARTWFEAKQIALRSFAAVYGIHEPEDLKGFILRDAKSVMKHK